MSKAKKELVNKLCENIVTSKEHYDWETCAVECVEDIEKITSLVALPKIGEIAASHNLGFYPASLLYHGKNIPDKKE